MAIKTVTYERCVEYRVDAAAARQLRDQGLSLRQIKAALGTNGSIPTISRAIKRAEGAA